MLVYTFELSDEDLTYFEFHNSTEWNCEVTEDIDGRRTFIPAHTHVIIHNDKRTERKIDRNSKSNSTIIKNCGVIQYVWY